MHQQITNNLCAVSYVASDLSVCTISKSHFTVCKCAHIELGLGLVSGKVRNLQTVRVILKLRPLANRVQQLHSVLRVMSSESSHCQVSRVHCCHLCVQLFSMWIPILYSYHSQVCAKSCSIVTFS